MAQPDDHLWFFIQVPTYCNVIYIMRMPDILCLRRYRNFRTFTTPEPTQFGSVAIEAGGEIVAAGSRDTFAIALWNMRTGQLVDVLSGHEGPVAALAFNPSARLRLSQDVPPSVKASVKLLRCVI